MKSLKLLLGMIFLTFIFTMCEGGDGETDGKSDQQSDDDKDDDDSGGGEGEGEGDDDDDQPEMDSSIIVDEYGLTPSLVCPGVKGCESAVGEFLVGVAKAAITPEVETWEDLDGNGIWNGDEPFDDKNGNGVWDPVWMAGFGQGRAATGVHDENWARALTFEKGDLSFAFVVLDLVGFFNGDVVKVRLAAKEAGLDFDHIMVSSTHQHEGKDTMGLWGKDFSSSGYDPAYIEFIVERAVSALKEAKANQRKARMEVALAQAPELVHDTRIPEVIDQNIYSANFIDENDEIFATMVVWGNHPEALGDDNTLITSDYPHYLREEIETHYPTTTAVFFSANVGGLMTTIGIVGCPDEEGKETCKQGTFERAEYVGKGAAERATEALDGDDALREDDPEVALRRFPFLAAIENVGFAVMSQIDMFTRTVYKDDWTEWDEKELKRMKTKEMTSGIVFVATEVNAFTLGPFEIVTVPGELYPELWLEKEGGGSYIEHPENADFPDAPAEKPIQANMPDDKIKAIINLGNDEVGYIIPKPQFDQLRPYAYEEGGQYGEINSLGPNAAPAITEAVTKMYSLSPK